MIRAGEGSREGWQGKCGPHSGDSLRALAIRLRDGVDAEQRAGTP